jgi:hypothetical protein
MYKLVQRPFACPVPSWVMSGTIAELEHNVNIGFGWFSAGLGEIFQPERARRPENRGLENTGSMCHGDTN